MKRWLSSACSLLVPFTDHSLLSRSNLPPDREAHGFGSTPPKCWVFPKQLMDTRRSGRGASTSFSSLLPSRVVVKIGLIGSGQTACLPRPSSFAHSWIHLEASKSALFCLTGSWAPCIRSGQVLFVRCSCSPKNDFMLGFSVAKSKLC